MNIRNMEFLLYLGHTDEERLYKQTVMIDIELYFPIPVKALHTDELKDTVCYQSLENALRTLLEGQTFRLLEHLGYTSYNIIQKTLPQKIPFTLSVSKFLNAPHGIRTFTLSNEE